MRILINMGPAILHGAPKEKVRAAFAVATWFCMGAFVSSSIFHYLDPLTSADLSGTLPSVLAGAVTALIAAFKSA